MRGATLAVALGATALLAVPSPAGAAPAAPKKVPLPSAEPFTGTLCGTTITVTEEVNRAKTGQKGKVTGTLRYRVTNVATGRSVVVNASGPGRLDESFSGDTVTLTITATGPSLFFALDAEELADFRAAGLPDLFVTRGPVTLAVTLRLVPDVGPVFVQTVVDAPQRVVDLCPVLTSG